MEVKTFLDAEKYLRENGLKSFDFCVSLDINNIEINTCVDKEYFISVGEWENGTFEVFAHSVGAKWNEEDFCVEDGKLFQYRIFKSLKRAINFALKCRKEGKLPDKYIKVW